MFKIIVKKNKKNPIVLLVFNALILLGCTRTCVGSPELGSKDQPVSIYLTRQNDTDLSRQEVQSSFEAASRCIERATGYRSRFEAVSDDNAVYSALARGDADIALTSALSYLDHSMRMQIQALLVVTQRGETLTRSVILGKSSRWQTIFNSQGLTFSSSRFQFDTALMALDNSRFIFVSPESETGFLVPRHMLFQRNIFPQEAVFAGSEDLVLQSVSRGIGIAGAVSENFLQKHFQSSVIQIGSVIDSFVVLAVSPGLPAQVVVVRKNLPPRVSDAISSGLETCVKGTEKNDIEAIFGGDGFFIASDRLFEFLREIQEFRSEFVRVLSPQ